MREKTWDETDETLFRHAIRRQTNQRSVLSAPKRRRFRTRTLQNHQPSVRQHRDKRFLRNSNTQKAHPCEVFEEVQHQEPLEIRPPKRMEADLFHRQRRSHRRQPHPRMAQPHRLRKKIQLLNTLLPFLFGSIKFRGSKYTSNGSSHHLLLSATKNSRDDANKHP